MNYTEAKAKLDALLEDAKSALNLPGLVVMAETEVIENAISESESEPLLILAVLALSAEGLTEDDTYYISAEAKIEGGEIDESALEDAIARFNARLGEANERLSAAEDIPATVIAMGKEVDDELERIYAEEVARSERAMKRDLKTAVIGAVGIFVVVILAVILSNLF